MALTLKHFLLFLFGINAIVMYLHAIAANRAAQQESLRTENLLFTMHPSTNPPLQELESSETILEENQHEIEIMQLELTKAQKLIAQLTIEKEELERTANQTTKISDNFSNKFEVAKKSHSYALEMLVKTNPFRKLGLYETMPNSYYNSRTRDSFIPNTQYYKIKHNPGYCDAVDLYNFHNPDNIFKNMNFISDYGGEELLIRKEVMRKIGNDVMPGVSVVTNPKQHQQPVYDMAINGTMFFFKVAVIHNLYQMNKEWACLTQTYNHIPGSGVISRKDLLAKTINNYSQRYINKPQCLSEETFFPRVYRLDVQSECNAFFNIFNSEQYEKNKADEPLQFLIKIGSGAHRAKGVFLLDQDYETKLRETYQNGQSCGRVQNTYIAQKYISNPLLLDRQNKFDFRIYMLVASTNPLIVYYHDGFLRISLSKYDKYSTEKNVHLTNTHLSKDVFKKAKEGNQFDGMNEQELRDYQMWTMEDLERYLLATGKIQDQDWLNSYLRPKFKEAFVHIARMAESSLYNSSSVFEMYGLDFVIDENLNLWFIECNPSPQMVGTNTKKTEFLVRMVQDLFEIQYAYLRSRMKRVFTFMRKMEEKAQNGEDLDYTKLKDEFDAVNINKLEPEFQISENNSFTLILDKNMNGPEAYFGNLAPECVDV